MREAPGRGKKRTWHEVDWQVVEKCLAQNRRYSARQLSQKLLEERQIELGAEQIRRLLKKGVALETYPLLSGSKSQERIFTS